MPLDHAHIRYLSDHHQGRLATVAPDGTPQNKPVGYYYNPELGTIDIAGFTMDTSAKYRNIAVHPEVSFVVDDAIGEGALGMRFVEVRGRAEQAQISPSAEEEGLSGHIIRIHPRRVVSWNADPEHPGLKSQTLAATAGSGSPTGEGRPTLGTNGLAGDEAAAVVANLVAELQAGIDTHDAESYNRHFVPTSSGAAPTALPSVATTTSTASTPPYWDTVSAGRHATRPFRPSPLPLTSSLPMSAGSPSTPTTTRLNPMPAFPRWRSTS